MNLFSCSKRTVRTGVGLASVAIVLLFVSLNVMYLFFASWEHIPGQVNPGNSGSDAHISVQVSNIHADVDGNINIELSLKVKELLDFLEGEPNKNGEATSNPIPQDVPLLINNPDVCDKSRDLKYIIYVHTSPGNFEKRDILRSTWASTDLFNDRIIERVFLMGLSETTIIQDKVKKESDEHKDIIQGDFLDNYRNLTLKGLMGLRWISEYCKQPKFAIKADDDAFVNIFSLVNLLEEKNHNNNILACPLWADNSMPILRDPAKCAKWCVRFNEFPGKRYFPQYCAGLTFALSTSLVTAMYKASKTTPFFWVDDVYITGLLPNKVKEVEYVKLIQNFTLKQDEALDEVRDLSKPFTRLFVHAKKPDQFRQMWTYLLDRLPISDVKLLSTDVIEQTPVLKRKISSSQ